MNRTWIIAVAAIVVFGVGGFIAGRAIAGGDGGGGNATLASLQAMSAEEAQSLFQEYLQSGGGFPGRGQSGGGPTGNGPIGGPPGGGFVSGTVFAKDDTSITVKLSTGSTQTVIYSDSTTISRSTSAKMADVQTGETVTVSGASNSDGSVTATRIQIVPEGETAGMPAPPAGGDPGSAPTTPTTTGS